MEEREILSIVWHRRSDFIDLAYAFGQPDSLVGTLEMATQLAGEAGLDLVTTTDGTVLWARNAGVAIAAPDLDPTGQTVGRPLPEDGWVTPWGWSSNRIWFLAFLLCAVVSAADALLGHRVILIGRLIVGPCCAVMTGRWQRTALAGLWAVALALALGVPDGIWGTATQAEFLGAVLVVALVSTAAALVIEKLQPVR